MRRRKTAADRPESHARTPEREPPSSPVQAFEKRIQEHEDILYGVALLFEGISLLYAGQEARLATDQKQFEAIIQAGKQTIKRATRLLNEVRRQPGQASMLARFNFSPCESHPAPRELEKRARALVSAYDALFPGRPRSQPFTPEETICLMERAAEMLPPPGGRGVAAPAPDVTAPSPGPPAAPPP